VVSARTCFQWSFLVVSVFRDQGGGRLALCITWDVDCGQRTKDKAKINQEMEVKDEELLLFEACEA
jgi:hypothetical protein